MRQILLSLCLSVVLSSLCACSLIDDHMTDCSYNRTIDCRVHVYEDIDSTLAGQIHGTGAQTLRSTLSSYYNGLLNPASRSVTMSFSHYATGDSASTVSRDISGNAATFTIDLPSGDLSCVAVTQEPLFTGRVLMPNDQDHHTLHLYPAGAQVAVVATVDSTITNVEMSVEGCATSFNAADSTYSYSDVAVPLPFRPAASVDSWRTYGAGVLPSGGKSWRVVILATTATGSVTRTVLTVDRPLRAGEIRVLQVAVRDNGAAQTTTVGVGASVTLDWKKGGQYDPDL